jgi:PAS domain S-box-containing protein
MKEERSTFEPNDSIKLSATGTEMSLDTLNIGHAYDRLLTRFVPSSVLVDQNRNVLHVFGKAGLLFKPSSGKFNSDLASMLPDDLRNAVVSAFQQALQKHEPIRFDAVETTKNNGEDVSVEIRVEPLPDDQTNKSLFLIQFIIGTNDSEEMRIQTLHRVKTDLQNLLWSTEVDTIFLDNKLRIRSFTPKSTNVINITSNDVGKAFESISSKIQNDDILLETRLVHEGEGPKEKRVTLPDGKVYLRRILPYRELDESINGIILTFADVTALSRAEATEKENAERVKLASAAGNFGIWERNLETNEIIWDLEMFNIYGIEPTQNGRVYYSDWSKSVFPEDLQHQEALIKKSLEGQDMIERKFRIRRKSDNQVRVIMGIETSRKDDQGKTISVVGINRDITEQHAALESDTLLAAIVRNSSDGILTKDLNGEITSWNKGATDILQYKAEEIVGQNVRTLAPKHLQAKGDSISKRIQSGELVADFQTQLCRKDGQLVDVSVSFFPVYNKQKTEVKLIASIIRDISENKRIQSKLRNADKLESLGIMAGGIAHEFNNLLTGILANVSIATPEANNNPQIQQSLKEIEHSSKQAADLCRQMLAYAGKTDSSLQHINLNELTRNAVASIKHSISKNVKTNTLLPKKPLFIKADPTQIQQVIMDLILNASEAVDGQVGQIDVTLQRIEAKSTFLKEADESYHLTDSPHAVLEIKDNGCGIKEADLGKIFDPFFTTKFTGRGLGLPAVRGILIAHSGALVVKSTLKVGSTFSVILPILEPPPISKEQAPNDIESIGNNRFHIDTAQKKKCLIIDDQECIRRALGRLLRKNGYQEVLIASDGKTGFELFKNHQNELDFVMLDLIMPRWNGAQTLSMIKQLNPNIPVIIMSGYIEDQVNDSLQNGETPEGFLQKPFDEKQLLKCLSSVADM